MLKSANVSLTGLLFVNFLCGLAQMIPWTSVFILLRRFGVFLYIIKNKDTCMRAQKRVQGRSSHITDEGKGYGFSIGYWYVAYIDVSNNDAGNFYNLWIIGTETSYLALTAEEDEEGPVKPLVAGEPVTVKSEIAVYERTGSIFNCWFTKRKIALSSLTPYPSQEALMTQIQAHYALQQHTVALICGPPGTGKSMIGVLLANHYRSAFCNTLRLWQPGDNLPSLYGEVEPKHSAPLILGFDEIDNTITLVHAGIAPHKSLPIVIPDKSGWNTFFDSIQRRLYPNVIIILTSNRSADYIRSIDPAYIREKRVDLIFDMNAVI